MTAEEIICEQLVELVTDYLDGALDLDVRAKFDAHLLECDGCVNYLEQFRSTISTLGRIPPDQLDDGFRTRLLGTFRGWTTTPDRDRDNLQPDT